MQEQTLLAKGPTTSALNKKDLEQSTISIVEDTELKKRLKKAYTIDECAKQVLNKVDGNFAIDEQGLIRYKGLVFKEVDRDSCKDASLLRLQYRAITESTAVIPKISQTASRSGFDPAEQASKVANALAPNRIRDPKEPPYSAKAIANKSANSLSY
ncbi:hypothetical protein V498_02553 [Pseudogymnoascus sp. VKM F-4517 (FW-2822)]|nr:hypothetical protein V498_02553 [Pseudogymnoascus sp. VKM F-4517 (FW-2822)]